MAVDGGAVANFILDWCQERQRPVTHLALQKLVFFCHVWSLVRLGKPLVKQSFEAWEHGPVLPHIYHQFKEFDASPIASRATQLDGASGKRVSVQQPFDEVTKQLLEEVVSFYSLISARDLRELSHVEGGPWFKVWNHQTNSNPGMKIRDQDIQEFYSRSQGNLMPH
jgi:uncharacterized phage-associated protein